ncbi:MAG: hypothetical protein ACREQI_11115 [Candidatus Binataceae bacterium]
MRITTARADCTDKAAFPPAGKSHKRMFLKAASICVICGCLFLAGCSFSLIGPPAALPAPLAAAPRCAIAPLGPRSAMPPAVESPAPLGSGFAGCFTLKNELALKRRITILHDDGLYCRAAYGAARKRLSAQNNETP